MRGLIVLVLLSLLGLTSPRAEPELRYLALGDSYTIGEGASPSERWPVQLTALLKQKGIAIGEPEIIARTGWTVAELSTGMDAAGPHGPFDLVTLLIGVNDQYRGAEPEAYRPAFTRMLARATTLAGGDPHRVVVLSIPDWGVTPFARESDHNPERIATAIDRFNAVNRQEAKKASIRFVDITPVSRRAGKEPAFLAPDGLHYSGAMYGEWARMALPVVMEAVSRREDVSGNLISSRIGPRAVRFLQILRGRRHDQALEPDRVHPVLAGDFRSTCSSRLTQ